MAQAGPARSSAAELAIDAAIPRPEPANVPPPTASDFKLDATASVPDAAKAGAEPASRPSQAGRDRNRSGTDAAEATARPTPPRRHPPRRPPPPPPRRPAEPVKAASNVPPADQPVADKLREMLGAKASRYFDRKGERAAVEKFYTAREFAPLWTQSGTLTAQRQGRHRAARRMPPPKASNAADYPVPDFAAATTPDALAEAELKLTASMLDYARQAQSGRMHWSQVAPTSSIPNIRPIPPKCWRTSRPPRTPRQRSRATIRRTSSTRN